MAKTRRMVVALRNIATKRMGKEKESSAMQEKRSRYSQNLTNIQSICVELSEKQAQPTQQGHSRS